MPFEFIIIASAIIGFIKGITEDEDLSTIIEKIIYRRK
jgi:hypothetical protein